MSIACLSFHELKDAVKVLDFIRNFDKVKAWVLQVNPTIFPCKYNLYLCVDKIEDMEFILKKVNEVGVLPCDYTLFTTSNEIVTAIGDVLDSSPEEVTDVVSLIEFCK